LAGSENIILVDASDPVDMPSFVDPNQVKVIIDHRAYHRMECFPNAVAQIEAVGAAATMIGEFFQHQSLLPSVKAATALYAGIASNTANFRAASTTKRDLSIARWLLDIAPDGGTFIQRMFLAKSDFANLSMKEVIDRDLSSKPLNVHGTPVAAAQLEVVGAERLIRARLEEVLTSLLELKESRQAERIFLLVTDLNEDRTFFVFPNTKDCELLTPILSLSDQGGFFAVDRTVSRKELMAKLME
jgi:manganese-dependent inorganic pyrophosphatase